MAPAAEHEALVHAAQHGAEEYITDCQAIIDEWSSGWAGCTSCSRVYAGYWRQLPSREAIKIIAKVKAHVEVPCDPKTEEEMEVFLNDKADTWAKKGRDCQTVPKAEASKYLLLAKKVQGVLWEAARRLAAFPRPAEEEKLARAERPQRGQSDGLEEAVPHEWWWTDRHWRCKQCLRIKKAEDSSADRLSCGPVAKSLQEMGVMAATHVLMASGVRDGHRVLIFCGICGAYAERQARKLCHECKRVPSGRGGPNLKRISRGLHPVEEVELEEPWAL